MRYRTTATKVPNQKNADALQLSHVAIREISGDEGGQFIEEAGPFKSKINQ